MRCTNGGNTYIQRCSAYGYRLENEGCYNYYWSNYVRRLSIDIICRQNLQGRKDRCMKTPKSNLPDSKFCHLYYDCADPFESKICPYPKFFSMESKKCEDYKKVKCGSRIQIKQFCQYHYLTQCNHECMACLRFKPSCAGLSDGRHIHNLMRGDPRRPWYKLCKDERLVKQGRCKNTRYSMDPTCLIECKGGDNRYYASTKCGIYVWCYYGRKFTYNCPAGTVFDKKRRSCQHVYDTCKPCGTKSC